MKRYVHISTAVVLAAASVLAASTASASTRAQPQKQQLTITIRPTTETFRLGLSTAGPAVRDSGRVAWQTVGERSLNRNGQRVRVWTGFGRFSATRGELVLRFRWEWLDAGRGYEAGVGTWSLVEGTDLYAGLRGSGTSAAVWLPAGPVASRVVGIVRKS